MEPLYILHLWWIQSAWLKLLSRTHVQGGCDSPLPCCTCWLPGSDRHWLGLVVVAIAVVSSPITSGCWESSWWGKPLYHYGNVSGRKWVLPIQPSSSEPIWLGIDSVVEHLEERWKNKSINERRTHKTYPWSTPSMRTVPSPLFLLFMCLFVYSLTFLERTRSTPTYRNSKTSFYFTLIWPILSPIFKCLYFCTLKIYSKIYIQKIVSWLLSKGAKSLSAIYITKYFLKDRQDKALFQTTIP